MHFICFGCNPLKSPKWELGILEIRKIPVYWVVGRVRDSFGVCNQNWWP